MKPILLQPFILFCTLILTANDAIAGPGGQIVKQVFDTPWGKVLLVIIVIVFAPFIMYSYIREQLAIRRTKKDLKTLASKDRKLFDIISLTNRTKDIFTRVHKQWSKQSMEECTTFMSDWYWQNQQLVVLDEWEEKNLENICNVKSISKIKPIHLRINDEKGYEESRVIMSVSSNMEDYLVDKVTNEIIEGKKGYNDVETLWTLVIENGVWKVDNIEQVDMLSEYTKAQNIMPEFTGKMA